MTEAEEMLASACALSKGQDEYCVHLVNLGVAKMMLGKAADAETLFNKALESTKTLEARNAIVAAVDDARSRAAAVHATPAADPSHAPAPSALSEHPRDSHS